MKVVRFFLKCRGKGVKPLRIGPTVNSMNTSMFRNCCKLGFTVLCFALLATQAGNAKAPVASDPVLVNGDSYAVRNLLEKIFKEEKSNKIVKIIKNKKMKV